MLVAATRTAAVVTGGESEEGGAQDGAARSAGAASTSRALELAAEPTGRPLYDKDRAAVKAGKVEIRLANASSVPHNALAIAAVAVPIVLIDAKPADGAGIAVDGLHATQIVLYDCPEGCSPTGHFKLWRPDGRGTLRRLDALGRRGSFITPSPPTLSPDGRWLAYTVAKRRLAVQRINLARGRLSGDRVVLPPVLHEVYDDTGVPAWSPDSRELAILGRAEGENGLWIVRRDGAELRRVVCSCDVPMDSDIDDGTWPAWSSRGEIAFTGVRERDDATALHVVSAGGGSPRRVTRWATGFAKMGQPAWSPDGSKLAYSLWSQFSSVTYVAAPGKRAQAIPGVQAPAWSPDGRSLAYVRGDANVLVASATSPRSARRLRSARALRDLGWIVRLQWLG